MVNIPNCKMNIQNILYLIQLNRPKYGEYAYLPPQRWLHSLEHGAIVLLYHPCANSDQVIHITVFTTFNY